MLSALCRTATIRKEDPTCLSRDLHPGSAAVAQAATALGKEFNSIHLHLQNADKYVNDSVSTLKKVVGRFNTQLDEGNKCWKPLEAKLAETELRLQAYEDLI